MSRFSLHIMDFMSLRLQCLAPTAQSQPNELDASYKRPTATVMIGRTFNNANVFLISFQVLVLCP